jgi:hypothetical protein
MVNDISYRIDIASRYLAFLSCSLSNWNWEQVELNEQDWVKRMVLIHPAHYENFICSDLPCPIRGKRVFDLDSGTQICASKKIWGYDCSCSQIRISKYAADHIFPYSFGGPTISENKLYLCELHNEMKSSDVHLFPWHLNEPPWLPSLISKIKRLRLSGV